ncbi:MAG TPA: hypothetical protein PK282_10830 [Rhodoglobus sp.]|nr:hypothetical protein [Rhodoglobus sp.]
MSNTITCPSGLVGRIRGMKAREERILADRKLARSGAQLEQILAACWEETLDAGPYDFGEQPIDWGKVLQGDRFFAMLQIRVLSYGPEYAFSVPCENRGCRARIEWELDLRELPVNTLSDESRAAFLASNRFETTLPDAGRKVAFRLLTGHDERRMAALRRAAGERPITTLLGYRLETIDGVEPREKQKFIEDLGMADVTFLLGEFDRVDCGVETEIEVECPECFGTTRIELPFEKGFFLPERRRTEPGAITSSRS